jgi:hypothetical protein
LFSKYLSNKPVQNGKLDLLSNVPFLFIILKSKGNLKKLWFNIKGYRAIKSLLLNNYNDVLISGINSLIYYMYYGYAENKFPNDVFEGNYYLNKYVDVQNFWNDSFYPLQYIWNL